MDLLSFGAALGRVLRRAQEESMTQTLNMRMAYHATGKVWKRYVEKMEKLLKPKKQGAGAFQAAFAAGHFKGTRREKQG